MASFAAIPDRAVCGMIVSRELGEAGVGSAMLHASILLAIFKSWCGRWTRLDAVSRITPDWTKPDGRDGVTSTTEGIADELQRYYSYLFRSRPSIDSAPFLQLLRDKSLPTDVSSKIEGLITTTEVKLAITKMGKANSPGPDLLADEFYQTFLDLVVGPLTKVLNEAHAQHELPTW